MLVEKDRLVNIYIMWMMCVPVVYVCVWCVCLCVWCVCVYASAHLCVCKVVFASECMCIYTFRGGGGGERSEPAHVSVCMNACALILEHMGHIF